MNIVRLAYASRLARNCGPEILGGIQAVARRNNRPLGVTGALCLSPRGFLQILEGPAAAVNELFRRIVKDPRHSAVTLIDYSRIPCRDFEHWSMASFRTDELNAALLRKYTARRDFDPFEMDPDQVRAFLLAAVRERAAVDPIPARRSV